MPRTSQNLADLRKAFGASLDGQKNRYSDGRISSELLPALGLRDYLDGISKREHLLGAVNQATDEELLTAVHRGLDLIPFANAERDALQELLWDDSSYPAIPAKYRRDVAKRLERIDLFLDREKFETELSKLWRMDDFLIQEWTSGS